jgi:hypothetical protein
MPVFKGGQQGAAAMLVGRSFSSFSAAAADEFG